MAARYGGPGGKPPLDMSGQRFGRLIILDQHKSVRRYNRQQIFWFCRCDCGTERWILGELLRRGTALSCGCLQKERSAENVSNWLLNRPGSAKFPGLKSRTKEYNSAYNKLYWQENKDWMTKEHAEWQRSERGHAWSIAYRAEHYDAEAMSEYNQARYQANPGRAKRYVINRRFRLEQRTPLWADIEAMDEFYRQRPQGHHVDHIIPLTGRTADGYPISGLHVQANLQYLPGAENNHKRIRMRRWEQNMCESTIIG
jgi:hypothetical protein